MQFEKGMEVKYVGPKHDSRFGGSLTNQQKDPNKTITITNIKENVHGEDYVIYVSVSNTKINTWIGLPSYFEPVNKSIAKIAENYNI